MAERFISVKDVVQKVCLSKTELYHRLRGGAFPKPIALGPKKVVFLETEIDAWMQARVEAGNSGAEWRRSRAQKAVAARRDRKVSL